MRKKGKTNYKKLKTGAGIAALVAAVAMFVVLIQMEKSIMEQYEKGTVYVAAMAIPKGELIAREDYGEYFKPVEMDKRNIPQTALTDVEQVKGMAPVFDVEEGVILTGGMFETWEEVLSEMEEPVIAGFKAEDMSHVAGGVLRVGDRIHIYSVKEEETVLEWESVYVQQVFDSAGESISNEDKTSIALRINVYLDKKDVEEFYSSLAMGTLRVVKVYK